MVVLVTLGADYYAGEEEPAARQFSTAECVPLLIVSLRLLAGLLVRQ
jgi:hypothetical protein